MTNSILILFIMIPTILIVSISYYYMQNFSNKNVFYGVNIPLKYRKSEELIELDKNYKKLILISTFIILLLQLFLTFISNLYKSNFIMLLSNILPLLILIFTSFYFYYRTYKNVLRFKKEHLSTINEDLNIEKVQVLDIDFIKEKDRIIKKYRMLYVIPLLITFINIVYVSFNYDKIPNMMPIHFNFYGVADGFIEKSKSTFLFQASIQIFILLIIYLSSLYTIKSRIKINKKDNIKNKIKYLDYLAFSFLIMLMSLSILFAATSFGIFDQRISQPFTFLSTILLLVSIVPMLYFSIKLESNKFDNSSYSIEDDDKYWILGTIYCNKNDPSGFVPKRFGIGWTINLGSKKGKFLLISTILFLVLILVFSINMIL